MRAVCQGPSVECHCHLYLQESSKWQCRQQRDASAWMIVICTGTCLRLAEVTGLPDPTPFSITARMHIWTGWNFLSFPGQLQFVMDLQPKLSLRRLLMDLSPKYNDQGLGRDMALDVCPWGLLVNIFEVALSKICIAIFFLFLSNLCATPTPAIMVRHDRVQYR